MGILNVTPDSFSDGGRFASVDAASARAEEMIAEGVDIIDIGGESTRPGGERVAENVEIERVVPVIAAIASRFEIPISIDTSKSAVAEAAVSAGAEIINDISGLRFDERIAEVAARHKTGLVQMHSRGEFDVMHTQSPVEDIISEVSRDFERSLAIAEKAGISQDSIVLDVGIGFGKTVDQNLELIAKLGKLAQAFSDYPLLVGASRKSFISKVLGRDVPPTDRLARSLAAAIEAVLNGASIVRVHDVRETVDAIRMVKAIRGHEVQ